MRNGARLAKYDTVAKQAMFEGEEVPGNRVWDGTHVRYLTDEELAQHRLTIVDGRISQADGTPFDTRDARTHWSGQGRAIFVMNAYGDIFASKTHIVGRFHHSSLGQGKPVAGAGELEVRDGKLVALTDSSSHYCPPRRYTEQVLHELQARGVDVDGLVKEFRY
ncbi:MAG TPA: hypothetical protein VJ806_11840 [Luteimonas sp.]|nr:hypothetical protein [Luteimonas sp.]